jgi:hypothetical protein
VLAGHPADGQCRNAHKKTPRSGFDESGGQCGRRRCAGRQCAHMPNQSTPHGTAEAISWWRSSFGVAKGCGRFLCVGSKSISTGPARTHLFASCTAPILIGRKPATGPMMRPVHSDVPGSMAPTARIDRLLAERRPPTPCIVLDLDVVRARYRALRQALPSAQIYYAVKANPAREIISALAECGASFDLASSGEFEICRRIGIAPARLSFGNTIKRESAIASAWAEGVNLFAIDSSAELEKLARLLPLAD